MFYKIKSVKPLPKYNVLVTFVNKKIKKYDVKRLFDMDVFKTLEIVKGLFEQVRVDETGYGIVWNDDIDLACNELYINGKSVK
jgi:Protein of unknown function (DUF2442).